MRTSLTDVPRAALQVNTVRDLVRKDIDVILQSLRSEMNGSGAGSATSRKTAQTMERLKGKIQNAIKVMSEGLVERDAEVRNTYQPPWGA
jgi:hypothetical protein